MQPLAKPDRRCGVCDQVFNAGEVECRNPVCAMAERWFVRNYAIAMRSGVLERVINAYKYAGPHDPDRAWAAIFGRILVGFLDANAPAFEDVDLIVASPTYTGEGARRSWDHIGAILVAADAEQVPAGRWPFDLQEPAAVVKTADTEAMTGKSYQERRRNAEGPLRASMSVPDPRRTAGRRIVVVDDVFTDGLTLREVARSLRSAGEAVEVLGISIARQPFRAR